MKIHKLSVKGFAHHLVFVIVVLAVAIGGAAYLVASHADSCPSTSGSLTSGSVTSGSTTSCTTGAGTLKLSPTVETRKVNEPVTFKIAANSGTTAVNAVEANLVYNKSQLQYVSTSLTGSPYTVCAQNSGGNGTTELSCAKVGGTETGNHYIGSVTFNVIGTGASTVSFGSASAIAQPSGTLLSLVSGSATLNLIAGLSSLSLSPSAATETVNNTFTVNVNESSTSSDAINTVQASLDYPSTELQYISSTCSSSFPLSIKTASSSGIANLVCSVPSKSYTGAQTVGTVTFKAIGAGGAAVTLDKSSEILIASNQANDWNGKLSIVGKYKVLPVK